MDPKMIIAAIPWLRRGWRLLPPPLRLPVFGAAAAVGIFLAISGRDELMQAIRDLRDGDDGSTNHQRGTAG